MKKLDDLLLYVGPVKKVTALVSRDRQLLRLHLSVPHVTDNSTWRLAIESTAQVKRWLAS